VVIVAFTDSQPAGWPPESAMNPWTGQAPQAIEFIRPAAEGDRSWITTRSQMGPSPLLAVQLPRYRAKRAPRSQLVFEKGLRAGPARTCSQRRHETAQG